jgi:hypothetical protein
MAECLGLGDDSRRLFSGRSELDTLARIMHRVGAPRYPVRLVRVA